MSGRADLRLDRSTAIWCAAAIASALLPLAPMMPFWLNAMLLVLVATATTYAWLGRVLSGWIRLPLTLAAAGVVMFAYGFRFGRDTGAALLVTMLALKLFETRTVRDARSALSFALFAVMASFLQNESPGTLALALLATVVALCALSRAAEFETAHPGAPEGLPLRARFAGAGRMLLISLPLAVAGFFLFPRLANPLWGLPSNVGEARTGLSDEMAPGDIANLFVDDTPVLRVMFDGPAPPQGQMYWRGPILTSFDGRKWTRSTFLASNVQAAALEPIGPPTRYEVTQEPTDRRYLITLDVPDAAPQGAFLSLDRMAFTRRAQTQMTRYRAESYTRYRFEPELMETLRRANLRLPQSFNPRTRAHVEQWLAQGLRGEQLVRQALGWFNAEFTYTLSPMVLGRDSVDDFLFDTRQGYCEHFASAFVVMMRMGGVPARVVTGYQGGRSNGIGDYWVVRQSDAHAWAEVWMEGQGWVRVDPTSAVAPQRIERGAESLEPQSLWRSISQPVVDASDWVRRGWNELVLGFNAQRQRGLLQPFGVSEATGTQLGIALGIAVGVALALTVGLLLRAPRRPRDPLQQAYAAFLARLARAGAVKPPHEGPIDYAERAAALLPHAASGLLALSRRYARRRYAADPHDAGADAQLCDDLRRFRVSSRNRAPLRRSA
jgi:transglutaminase-like putative cysteine protease